MSKTPEELYQEIVRKNPNASEQEHRHALCEALRAHPEIYREAFAYWSRRTEGGQLEEESLDDIVNMNRRR